ATDGRLFGLVTSSALLPPASAELAADDTVGTSGTSLSSLPQAATDATDAAINAAVTIFGNFTDLPHCRSSRPQRTLPRRRSWQILAGSSPSEPPKLTPLCQMDDEAPNIRAGNHRSRVTNG
ncbi:hypothetical protein G3I15_26375, partial [Streptomyces sp. SID10244]|nr:hypothetical protein [Streptomyces sp. SID10244]